MKTGHMRLYAGGWENTNTVQTGRTDKQNRHSVPAMFQRKQNSQDKAAQKKVDAREKAMRIVSNAFQVEKSIDDDLDKRAGRIETAKAAIAEAQKQLRGLDEQQQKYMENYGITADSQEQQDLELLRKRRDSMGVDSDIQLTEEEQERLKEIDANGLTDYQRLSLENDSYRAPFNKDIRDNQKVVQEEQIIMREIGLERLKSHTMADATQQKDAEMEAANKEIIGMVLQDGRDKVDEDMQEVRDELADRKEEAKEEEQRIEEIQQRADELEKTNEERRKKNDTDISELISDRILELDSVKNEVSQKVDNMLYEMNLLKEDLKGSVVDTEA